MRQIESFFWGIIAALAALFVQLLVYIGLSAQESSAFDVPFEQFYAAPLLLVVAALIEECFKYLMISKRVELVSLGKTYVFNAFLVGLGFFSTELALINLSYGEMLPVYNLAEIAIIHLGTAGIMGYIVGTSNPSKFSTFLRSIIPTIAIHTAYNLLIINRGFMQDYLIYTLLGFVILFNLINFIRISSRLAQD